MSDVRHQSFSHHSRTVTQTNKLYLVDRVPTYSIAIAHWVACRWHAGRVGSRARTICRMCILFATTLIAQRQGAGAWVRARGTTTNHDVRCSHNSADSARLRLPHTSCTLILQESETLPRPRPQAQITTGDPALIPHPYPGCSDLGSAECVAGTLGRRECRRRRLLR
jgi:hypothetical protein